MSADNYEEPNRELLVKIERAVGERRLQKALHGLGPTGLWSGVTGQKNLKTLLSHKSPAFTVAALNILQTHGFLSAGVDNAKTQALFNRVLKVEDVKELTKILRILSVNGYLSKESEPQFLDKVLDKLDAVGDTRPWYRWTKSIFDWLSGERTPKPPATSISGALHIMSKSRLLEGPGGVTRFDKLLKHPSPALMSWALKKMYDSELLDDEDRYKNFDALLAHKAPVYVAIGAYLLGTNGVLKGVQGQKNFDAFMQHPNTKGLVRTIARVSKAGLFESKSAKSRFHQLLKHPHPQSVALAIKSMQKVGLLTGEYAEANFNALMLCENMPMMAVMIKRLADAKLLSGKIGQMNFERITSDKHPKQLFAAVSALFREGFLAGPSAQAVLEFVIEYHRKLPNFGETLQRVSRLGLLSGPEGMTNFQNLLATENPKAFLNVLEVLDRLSLIEPSSAQAIYSKLLTHPALDVLVWTFKQMARAGLLSGTQATANLDAIIAHPEIRSISWILHDLNQAGLTGGAKTQDIFNTVLLHKNPKRVAGVVRSLYESGLLQDAKGIQYLQETLTHKAPQHLSFLLSTMREVGLLVKGDPDTKPLVEHVFTHNAKDLAQVAWAMKRAHNVGLLSSDKGRANAVMLVLNQRPQAVLKGLKLMQKAGLLEGENGQRNFDTLVRSNKADAISWMLGILDKSDMLPAGDVSQHRFKELALYLTRYLNAEEKQDEVRIFDAAMHADKAYDLREILTDPRYFHDDMDLGFVMQAFVKHLVTEAPTALTKASMQEVRDNKDQAADQGDTQAHDGGDDIRPVN